MSFLEYGQITKMYESKFLEQVDRRLIIGEDFRNKLSYSQVLVRVYKHEGECDTREATPAALWFRNHDFNFGRFLVAVRLELQVSVTSNACARYVVDNEAEFGFIGSPARLIFVLLQSQPFRTC